ncbi:MAG TPA: cytochrome c oxidase assembly protein [Rhizobiales bacterium]|jgi:surfeit locus 1 family protein|nr:cytochrome c oxidase assembly protein [Hyphomicrobiales bacterium]HCL60900.1 cytochrome c oxidase assembly protein [Hyphomicrobiales bacterium]
MRTKGLLGFTALALAALAVLIGLGVWQLERLQWKEGLIAEIEARSTGAPITIAEALAIARQGRDPDYYRVRVEGRFHHDKERYLFAQSLADGTPGWHVITPLETTGEDMVLVDRGFVPDVLKEASSRASGQVEGVVTVTGIVRSPEIQGSFVPDNEREANRWFWRDLGAMARSMFPEGTVEMAPFFLDAEKSDVPGGWPEGGQTRLELPNNHLQYAITWFLLALCLLVIYAVYVRGLYRRRRP